MSLRPPSTSARLVLLIATVNLLAMLSLGCLVYFAVSAQLDRDTRSFVNAEASDLLGLYAKSGAAALREEVSARDADPADADMVYALLDAGGGRVVGHPLPPALAAAGAGWHEFVDSADADHPRVIARVAALPDGTRLLTGLQTRAEDGFLQVMSRTAALALVVAGLIGVAMGWLVSRWIALRLQRIDEVIDRVAMGDIGARVDADGSHDAFDLLGMRINRMLDRLVELMDAVRDVGDHIAHDLRTPLTRLRNRLSDVRRLGPEQTPDAVEGAIEETDQLLQTFAALLRLSRIERQPAPAEWPRVALDALAQDVVEMYEPLAQTRGIKLQTGLMPAMVQGDGDQLFQAIVNLLDNALKYAPPDSDVCLRSGVADGQAWLQIEDAGEGIPETERHRVFDRFARLERHRGSPGNGLGLPLVRAVMQRHGGGIELREGFPGLVARLTLPAAH